jgi:nucleotide-binding universal stress UspA family protein
MAPTEAAQRCSGPSKRPREHGSELLLISVWTPSPAEIAPPFGSFPWGTNVDLTEAAEQAHQELLQGVMGEQDDVKVKTQVVSGNAAKVLIDSSQDADLLVVGSRGHGGFAGMLLGSVSQHVAAHASCPVVVVRCRNGRFGMAGIAPVM